MLGRQFLSAFILLGVSACSDGGGGPPIPEFPPDHGDDVPRLDAPVIDRPGFSILVNDARAGGALMPVAENALLSEASRLHAVDMEAHDYFSHTGRDGSSVGDRARASGYEWRWVAENIAWGFPDGEAVFEAWMGSPGHEANIMAPEAMEFGIGREDGTWVMILAAPR